LDFNRPTVSRERAGSVRLLVLDFLSLAFLGYSGKGVHHSKFNACGVLRKSLAANAS